MRHLVLAACLLAGCELPTQELHLPDLVVIRGATTQLVIPTYEGSGHCVHPDIVYAPTGWSGWEYWLAFTPYPRSSTYTENPSIVVSHDGIRWQVPPGGSNPVVPFVTLSRLNSDPDLRLDAGVLTLLSRVSVLDTGDVLYERRSADGTAWTAPQQVLSARTGGALSPTRVGDALWVVDAGPAGCSARSTSVWRHSPEGRQQVTLVQPGFVLWHIDVIWHAARGEYWALYPAYPVGLTCDASDLFLARSLDGVHWQTRETPILSRQGGWLARSIYRATGLASSRDTLRVWFSAHGADSTWHIGYTSFVTFDSVPPN